MNGQTGTPGVCRGGRDGDAGIHRRRASFLVIVCQLGNMAAPAGLAMLIGQLLNTFGAAASTGPPRCSDPTPELFCRRRQCRCQQKEAAMTENTPSRLGNVITIDDERIKSHLDRVAA
jgi:hypothetical protein